MSLDVDQRSESFKVTVRFQRRADGGLRAWSDEVPELVLSNQDPQKVLADIVPALELILSAKMQGAFKAEPLQPLVRLPSTSPDKARQRLPSSVNLPAPIAAFIGALGPLANLFNGVEYSAHRYAA